MKGISPRTFFVIDALAAFSLSRFAPQFSIAGSASVTFIGLFVLSLLWILIYESQIWPKFLSPLRSLPQAPGASFLNGHFWQIRKQETGLPAREWVQTVPNKGLIAYQMMFNDERVFPTSPEALREVLVTKSYDYRKPDLARRVLGRLLGFGVLLAEGEEHKFQRKNLMPAFAYRHVKDLVPTFWSKGVEMVRYIEKENSQAFTSKDGAIVKISSWLSRCTLDIIGVTGMGFDFNALKDPDTELNATYRRVFTANRAGAILDLMSAFFPTWLLRSLPVSRNSDIAEAAKVIRRVSKGVIQEKKRKMEAAREKGTQEDIGKDIISVALESDAFTEDNLVDQVMTFLAAGHETTSTATTWALLALARHPQVQTKLREEIREHLPSISDENATVTAEDIDAMHYLHAVCEEVLRFHPPVPLTRREALRDTVLLDQPIPKGTSVVLIPNAINFNPKLWGDDADQFKPERWLGTSANSGGASSNFASLTFLHGPRSCIGQKFAQIEFACLLAAVVGRFEFELYPKDYKLEIEGGITARPKGGLHLKMKTVEGW